ncbi:MAG: zinc ribbon domain-containing protein [Acidobacteriota bacterium]
MPNCKWCGNEILPGADLCPSCGHFYEQTVACRACGTEVPLGIRLCSYCGHFMDYAEPQVPGVAGPAGVQGVAAGGVATPQAPPASDVYAPAGVPTDSVSTWSAARRDEAYASGQRIALKQTVGLRTDPWYVAAVGASLFSLMFFWVPRFDIGVAIISLVICGVAIVRYFRRPGEFGGAWVVILAVVLALLALFLSIDMTFFAEGGVKVLLEVLLTC